MMHSDWPKYRAHKIVQAAPITDIRDDGSLIVGGHVFDPSVPGMRQRAKIGDYAVVYEDGYTSVSPKTVFEDGYAPVGQDGYTPDQQRVADWLRESAPEIGAGDDPIGFLLACVNCATDDWMTLRKVVKEVRDTLSAAMDCTDPPYNVMKLRGAIPYPRVVADGDADRDEGPDRRSADGIDCAPS